MSETVPSTRLLRLLGLLQIQREWSGTELAERLGVSRRTVRRDIERLREQGYPVLGTRGSVGGYRLRAGSALPPLMLDDEEAVAIAAGLRSIAATGLAGVEEAADRALTKLERLLPTRLRRRLRTWAAATTSVPSHADPATPEILALLADASVRSERVGFDYRGRDGAESDRLVDPYRLVSTGRRWYLVGYDLAREDWRTFRVDRMARPRATGTPSPERTPPVADAAEFLAGAHAAFLGRYRAVATIDAPMATVAERVPEGEVTLEPLDDERTLLWTGSDYLEWIGYRIAGLGLDFEVHEPPELVNHLRDLHDRLGRALAAHDREG